MDDKILEDRFEELISIKKFTELTFLESLAYKSISTIEYSWKEPLFLFFYSKHLEIIQLLIEAEEEINELIKSFYPKSDISNFNNDSDIKLHELDLISPSLIDIYVEFDKKLNAKIEEVFNENNI